MQKHVTKRDQQLKEVAASNREGDRRAGGAPQAAPRRAVPPAAGRPAEVAAPKAASISAELGNSRSGPEYYRKWDQVAESEGNKLASEEAGPVAAAAGGHHALPASAGSGPENTRRLCAQELTQSHEELCLLAENEKCKGNECFNAKEWEKVCSR